MNSALKSPRVLLPAAALCLALGIALAVPPQGRQGMVDFSPPDEDICIVPPARVMAATPYDPASGLAIHDARPVPPEARCPVCGMYPARHPRWAAQLIFADGAAHFFDSPVDLFLFLQDPARYDSARSTEAPVALYVTDFAAGGWVDARQALFVDGSQVRGPMRGADLPAFASRADAEAFIAANGGELRSFDAIGPALIAALRDLNHAH